MIAQRVLTKEEVEQSLRTRGFSPTDQKTTTGTFWRDAVTDRHILVPFDIQGYYPDWLLGDLMLHIGQIPTYSSIVIQEPIKPPKRRKGRKPKDK